MNWSTIGRTLNSRNLFILIPLSWLLMIALVFTISNVFERPPTDLKPLEVEIQFNKLNVRLNEANKQIDVLMQQNRDLSKHLHLLTNLKKRREYYIREDELKQIDSKTDIIATSNPTIEFEQSLRRTKQNIDEIWLYLRKTIDHSSIKFVTQLRYNMFIDLDILSERDNRWREQQRRNLSEFIDKKLTQLQNPKDCKTAYKLVCDLNKACGLGCQLHHLAHCLVAAMALNRTLIVLTDEWRTENTKENVWNKVFQPFSQTCVDFEGYNSTDWGKHKNLHSYQVIYYPIIDFINPIPPFLPLVIPQQISNELIELSDEPFICFIGHVLKYIMRPNANINAFIEHFKKKINFRHPIVGIHVRRTDKVGSEAKFHSIDEYMLFVEDFFNKLDLKNERNLVNKSVDRVVYLATDEPEVWQTEILPYKQKGYKFTGDIRLSQSADPIKRMGFESLHNVIVDLLLLSQCDYIVCTFSSQICRIAFELMQTQYKDLSNAYYSLDDIYYFGGQVFHGKKAITSHLAQNKEEISFSTGDILGIANNKHNGFNFGDNKRTKTKGIYPRFKVTEFVESIPFAIFN